MSWSAPVPRFILARNCAIRSSVASVLALSRPAGRWSQRMRSAALSTPSWWRLGVGIGAIGEVYAAFHGDPTPSLTI